MAPSKSKTSAKCGAKRKNGEPCQRGAGWGTEQPGKGPCKLHGGRLPNVVTRYARIGAIEQARVYLDDPDLDIEPTDAALFNVKVAHTMVRFQRAKVAALEVIDPDDVAELDRAIRTAQHVTDVALKANIAERLVNIAERAGETLALICEEGIAALIAAGLKISPEQRVVYAKAIEAAAQRFEDEPVLELQAAA